MKEFLHRAPQSFAFTQGTKELSRQVCPFLKASNIKNFYYVQISKKGELVYLTNDVGFAMDYWEAGLPLRTGFSEPLQTLQRYTVDWKTTLDQEILAFAQAKGGYNGFSYIERYPDMVQFASFLFASEHTKADKQALESFLRQFQWSNKKLIRHTKDQPMQLPEAYLKPQNKTFYSERSIPIRYNGIQASIRFRELDCLTLYGRGFTITRIGELLEISSRTVETHLESVKNRFGLSCRDDLAELCYLNSLLQTYMPRFSPFK